MSADAPAPASTPVPASVAKAAANDRSVLSQMEQQRRSAAVLRARAFYRSSDLVKRLRLEHRFEDSIECINSVRWSSCGKFLLAGGDDRMLRVWNVEEKTLKLKFPSGHRGNIFHGEFVPCSDNMSMISCGSDGQVRFHRVHHAAACKVWRCNSGQVHRVAIPKSFNNVFYSCGADSSVRRYDLREPHTCRVQSGECKNVLFHAHFNYRQQCCLYSIDLHPQRDHLILLSGRSSAAMEFDLRYLDSSSLLNPQAYALYGRCEAPMSDYSSHILGGATDARYSWNGSELIVSFSPNKICLFDHVTVADASVSRATDDSDANSGVSSRCRREMVAVVSARPRSVRLTWPEVPTGREAFLREENAESWDSSDESGAEDLFDWLPDHASPFTECEKVRQSVRVFSGHRSERTVKEVGFFGPNSEFIVSGSDDGNIFIWRKSDGEIVQILHGDENVVNCVQPHPQFPYLATSGMDSDVKLWTPTANRYTVPDNIDSILHSNMESVNERPTLIVLLSRMRRQSSESEDGTDGDREQ